MALVYDFNFTPLCAGLQAQVTDATGADAAGSPITLDANGAGRLSLAEGVYIARTTTANRLGGRDLRVTGVLNVAASVELAETLPVTP